MFLLLMDIKMQLVLDAYREEIAKLANENVLLRAQIRQLQNELEKKNEEEIPE